MMMVPICCLIAAGEKMSTGDGLGPECPQDSSMILGVEGGQFVEVAFSHPPAFGGVQKDGKYAALLQS